MATVIITSVMYFVFMVFQCKPISYFWHRFSNGEGFCFPVKLITDLTIVFSVFVATADLIFGILPIFVIWDLKINRRTKVIVGGLLTLGIFAGLSVIVRIYYIHSLRSPEEDFTFLTFKVSIWAIVEPAIGIICMAITTYRPLFKSLADKFSHASRTHTTTTHPHTEPNTINKTKPKKKSSPTGIKPPHSTSKSRNGYTTSESAENLHTFEDVLELEGLQWKPTVTGGRGNGRERADTWDEDFIMKDGIMMSTTVEVHRSPNGDGDIV
ncbi:hypothetical protein ACEPPN_005925 [Leptodophora sp. 'Broadleaf-Isolate-01']